MVKTESSGIGRVALSFTCRLFTLRDSVRGVVTDLSADGLCARIEDPEGVDPVQIRNIEIDGLGGLEVLFRWRRDDCVGLSFRRAHVAQPRIDAFLHRQMPPRLADDAPLAG